MKEFQGRKSLLKKAKERCSLIEVTTPDIVELLLLIEAVYDDYHEGSSIDEHGYLSAAIIQKNNTCRDAILDSLEDPVAVLVVRQHLATLRLIICQIDTSEIDQFKKQNLIDGDAWIHNLLFKIEPLLVEYSDLSERSARSERAKKIAEKAKELALLIDDDPYWKHCLRTNSPEILSEIPDEYWPKKKVTQGFPFQRFLYGLEDHLVLNPFPDDQEEEYLFINGETLYQDEPPDVQVKEYLHQMHYGISEKEVKEMRGRELLKEEELQIMRYCELSSKEYKGALLDAGSDNELKKILKHVFSIVELLKIRNRELSEKEVQKKLDCGLSEEAFNEALHCNRLKEAFEEMLNDILSEEELQKRRDWELSERELKEIVYGVKYRQERQRNPYRKFEGGEDGYVIIKVRERIEFIIERSNGENDKDPAQQKRDVGLHKIVAILATAVVGKNITTKKVSRIIGNQKKLTGTCYVKDFE